MLLVLYGTTANVGKYSRDYFADKGFRLVTKYSCKSDSVDTKERFGSRTIVSQDDFYKYTDSLFRYNHNGVMIGFNKEQIVEAVCNRTNAVLTLSAPNLDFVREIKKVYGDTVLIVYCYIGIKSLRKMIEVLQDVSDDEIEYRLLKEQIVREQYISNCDLFDKTVIFDGDDGEFNFKSLELQYDNLISPYINDNSESDITEFCDVFLSCSHADIKIANDIRYELERKGVSVFEDRKIEIGVNWSERLYDALLSAKAIVVIVSKNTANSKYLLDEVKSAVEIAERSATLIVPIFIGFGFDYDKSDVLTYLASMVGITVEENEIDEIPERLSERLIKLFTGEKNLSILAEKVGNYVEANLLDEALEAQKQHYALCVELLKVSNGKLVNNDATLSSQIKLIDILKKLQKWDDALEESIDALQGLYEYPVISTPYDFLCESFGECCARKEMTEEQVEDVIEKYISKWRIYEEYGTLGGSFNKELCDELLRQYRNAKAHPYQVKVSVSSGKAVDDQIVKIADHGESAIKLFDDMAGDELTDMEKTSIIEGYQRILNYCVHNGMKNDVSGECIKRISELREKGGTRENSDKDLCDSLKIYLGQALPGSGDYDVFISYKSEDERLAQKVYRYLIGNGKEVFFSKESLTRIGDSDYRKVIFDVLSHSKHLILVGSNPEYFKTEWVSSEWNTFLTYKNEGKTSGNLIMVLPDEFKSKEGHDKLPDLLKDNIEIVGTSEFRERLLNYLW